MRYSRKLPAVPKLERGQWCTRHYLRRVGLILLIAALAATLLFVWISQSLAWHGIVRIFSISVIHSTAIGLPCALLIPRLSLLVEERSRRAKLATMMATIFVVTTVGCLASNLAVTLLGLQSREALWPSYWSAWRISVVIAMAFGMGSYLYESLRGQLEETQLQLQAKELEQERTEKLAAEARLSSLEARIHPHFLFNTLNSISSLIPEDPKRAEDMVGKLAALLRFSLDAHRRSLVPLEQELKIVRDYLEIEKARFADRLRYSVEVAPGAGTAEVPPLAVQTLVENSIKHVVAPRREGGDIAVRVRNSGALEVEVSDSGPGFNLEDAPPGHGLDNLRARLHVLFGGEAGLHANRENGCASVRITLPAGS